MNRFLTALCAATGIASPALAASPLDSTFASAPPAPLWALQVPSGSGPVAQFTNDRLEISFPDSSSGSVFGAGLVSSCQLSGDFDVAAEYVLLDWPGANGVRTGLYVGGAVERTSFSTWTWNDFPGEPREVYLTNFSDGVQGIVETADLAGKLRLVRAGTALTGLYQTATGWAPIHTGPVVTDDLAIYLSAWSHDNVFIRQPVRMAFTSFQVLSGRVVCGGAVLVPVDVKPGSVANPIKVTSNGTTPVAILTSDALDASTIDPTTVTVAGALAAQAALEDVNGDGLLDLVVHVETGAMSLPPGTTYVEVDGAIVGGGRFVGWDRVTLLP